MSQETNAGLRVSLLDGVGHGPAAATAANAAILVLADHPESSPLEALRACHQALQHTRGAVGTVVVITSDGNTLQAAGVGNIDCHLWTPEREQLLVTQRGMLGFNIPTIRPLEFALGDEWMLVLHSDGVSARFHASQYISSTLRQLSPAEVAQNILADHGHEDDDATVVVILP